MSWQFNAPQKWHRLLILCAHTVCQPNLTPFCTLHHFTLHGPGVGRRNNFLLVPRTPCIFDGGATPFLGSPQEGKGPSKSPKGKLDRPPASPREGEHTMTPKAQVPPPFSPAKKNLHGVRGGGYGFTPDDGCLQHFQPGWANFESPSGAPRHTKPPPNVGKFPRRTDPPPWIVRLTLLDPLKFGGSTLKRRFPYFCARSK